MKEYGMGAKVVVPKFSVSTVCPSSGCLGIRFVITISLLARAAFLRISFDYNRKMSNHPCRNLISKKHST